MYQQLAAYQSSHYECPNSTFRYHALDSFKVSHVTSRHLKCEVDVGVVDDLGELASVGVLEALDAPHVAVLAPDDLLRDGAVAEPLLVVGEEGQEQQEARPLHLASTFWKAG